MRKNVLYHVAIPRGPVTTTVKRRNVRLKGQSLRMQNYF